MVVPVQTSQQLVDQVVEEEIHLQVVLEIPLQQVLFKVFQEEPEILPKQPAVEVQVHLHVLLELVVEPVIEMARMVSPIVLQDLLFFMPEVEALEKMPRVVFMELEVVVVAEQVAKDVVRVQVIQVQV